MTALAWLRDDDSLPLAAIVQPQPIPDRALALAPVLDTDCPVCLESPEFCPGTCDAELLAESGYYGAPEVHIGRAA